MSSRPTKSSGKLQFDDEKRFTRIGMIALATDLTSEHDFRLMLSGPGVRLHVSRTYYSNPVTGKNLQAMQDGISHSASLLVPDTPLKAIYFSCTSGSASIGQEAIEKKIQNVRPHVPVITPLSAALQAFRVLKAQSISILTPYTGEVAELVGAYFTDNQITIDKLTFLGLDDDRMMARLSRKTIVEAARSAFSKNSDALFISCTALRSAEVVGELEDLTGRPVVGSNQAAAWLTMLRAGLDPSEKKQFGCLMTREAVSC